MATAVPASLEKVSVGPGELEGPNQTKVTKVKTSRTETRLTQNVSRFIISRKDTFGLSVAFVFVIFCVYSSGGKNTFSDF